MSGIESVAKYAILVAVILITACNEKAINEPVYVNTHDARLQSILLEKLASKEIPYEVHDDTSIIVNTSDVNEVVLYLNQIMTNFLPLERSTAIAQPFRAKFLALLEEENIPYEEISMFGQKWIVWPEEYGGRVERLLQEVSTER